MYPNGSNLPLLSRIKLALATTVIEIQLRPQGNSVGLTIPKELRNKMGKLEAGDVIGLKVCNRDSLTQLANGMDPLDKVIVMILGAVKKDEA